MNSDL